MRDFIIIDICTTGREQTITDTLDNVGQRSTQGHSQVITRSLALKSMRWWFHMITYTQIIIAKLYNIKGHCKVIYTVIVHCKVIYISLQGHYNVSNTRYGDVVFYDTTIPIKTG